MYGNKQITHQAEIDVNRNQHPPGFPRPMDKFRDVFWIMLGAAITKGISLSYFDTARLAVLKSILLFSFFFLLAGHKLNVESEC